MQQLQAKWIVVKGFIATEQKNNVFNSKNIKSIYIENVGSGCSIFPENKHHKDRLLYLTFYYGSNKLTS